MGIYVRHFLFFLSVILSVSTYSNTLTTTLCGESFFNPTSFGEKLNAEYSQELIQAIKEKNIPSFYRVMGERKIPVVLINQETYPTIARHMEYNYGQVLNLTGHGNDHGMLLLGSRDLSHRTVFMRNSGKARHEVHVGLHDTYIDILDFNKTVQKSRGTYIIISYRMTKTEMLAAHRYSKVRRSGIFHVPSGFDPLEPIPGAFHSLCTKGEKCYDYIAGTITHQEQINKMKEFLYHLSGQDADTFLNNPLTVQLRQKLIQHFDQFHLEHYASSDLASPWRLQQMAQDLNPQMMAKPEFIQEVSKLLPGSATDDTKIRVLNMLVGIDALSDYQTVTRRLGVTNYEVWPDHLKDNPRLTAMFVVHTDRVESTAGTYSDSVIKAFREGTYENTFGVGKHHLGDHKRWHLPLLNP